MASRRAPASVSTAGIDAIRGTRVRTGSTASPAGSGNVTVDAGAVVVGAALVLGAAGALMGTRFQATIEALVVPEMVEAIIDGRGDDTERSRVLDVARGARWPERYTARTLRNAFLDRWRGRDAELETDEGAKADYRTAADRGDLSVVPVWAGEAIDLITDVTPAADLVARIAGEAEEAVVHVGANLE